MITIGKWMSEDLSDMFGRPFKIGDRVVRAITSGRAANLSICKVTDISGGMLFLDDSKRCINYPGRLLIVNDSVPKNV